MTTRIPIYKPSDTDDGYVRGWNAYDDALRANTAGRSVGGILADLADLHAKLAAVEAERDTLRAALATIAERSAKALNAVDERDDFAALDDIETAARRALDGAR